MSETKIGQRPVVVAAEAKPDNKKSAPAAKVRRPSAQAYARFLLDRHRHAD